MGSGRKTRTGTDRSPRRRSLRKWGAVAAVVLPAVATAAALWVRNTYVAITVDGGSMLPTLSPGDRVLIRRGRKGLRRGRIVVIGEPDFATGWRESVPVGRRPADAKWYIKRLVALPGDPMPEKARKHGDVVPPGHIIVIGDHPLSGDSKQHGPCPIHQVLGVVVRDLERETPLEDAGPPPVPPPGVDLGDGSTPVPIPGLDLGDGSTPVPMPIEGEVFGPFGPDVLPSRGERDEDGEEHPGR